MEAIKEIPQEVRERLSRWVYIDNADLSPADIRLLRRAYRETWRYDVDWSCSICVNKALMRIHRALQELGK